MEREPVQFLLRKLTPLLDDSRNSLAELLGAEPADVVFVTNVTAGVNAVLRSLDFRPGDEILATTHDYNACRNAAHYVAQRSGATVVVVDVPRAGRLAATGDRRRVGAGYSANAAGHARPHYQPHGNHLSDRGLGAGVEPSRHRHAGRRRRCGRHGSARSENGWAQPTTRATATNGSAPKGAGFLYVRRDRQEGIQPPIISHGWNRPREGYSPLQDAFDWPGTSDPTPWLCVGEAINFVRGLMPGGLPALMRRNHELAMLGRQILCQRLGVEPVGVESMLGSMAAVLLPDATPTPAMLEAQRPCVPIPRGRSTPPWCRADPTANCTTG